MDISRKILRVSAILLAGILWSVSSQASWISNAFSRFGLESTQHPGRLAVFGRQVPERAHFVSWGHNPFPQETSIRMLDRSKLPLSLTPRQFRDSTDIVRTTNRVGLISIAQREQLKRSGQEVNGIYRTHNLRISQLSAAYSFNRHVFVPNEKELYVGTDVGRALPRLALDHTLNQEQLKGLMKEVDGNFGTYSGKSPQEHPGQASGFGGQAILLNQERSRSGAYKSWKHGNRESGHGRQNETNQFIREKIYDAVEKGAEKSIECLEKYHHNGNSIDNDFLFNAIQECYDKEEQRKLELGRTKLFDKLGMGCGLIRDGSPCFTNERGAVILNVPIWEREFYNSLDEWKEIQRKSALIPISRSSLALDLSLPNWRREFSFQISAPKIDDFRATDSTYQETSVHHHFDIGQNGGAILEFWNEAIAQSHKLSDCLDLWEIKYRHDVSIRELSDSVIKDADKGSFAGATSHSG